MLDEQRTVVFQQFGRTYRAFLAAFESHVGQPMPRWRILLQLYQHDGAQSQKQLAEVLRIDPGALTRQLKILEQLAWISRSTDERDNRVTNVVLTEPGAEIVRNGLPHREAFITAATESLTDDTLAQLCRGLAMLEEGIAVAQRKLLAERVAG